MAKKNFFVLISRGCGHQCAVAHRSFGLTDTPKIPVERLLSCLATIFCSVTGLPIRARQAFRQSTATTRAIHLPPFFAQAKFRTVVRFRHRTCTIHDRVLGTGEICLTPPRVRT